MDRKSRLAEGMIVKHFKRKADEPADSKDHLFEILHMNKRHIMKDEHFAVLKSLYDNNEECILAGDIVICPQSWLVARVDRTANPDTKNEYIFEEFVQTYDRIQCAACGYTNHPDVFFNFAVHSKVRICPICGTLRFVCDGNRDFRSQKQEERPCP